jgi:hypothetical protein
LCTCQGPEPYSDIPEIKFIGAEYFADTTYIFGHADPIIYYNALLAFYFQDGEGDLGLDERDLIHPPFNTSPYNYNLFIDVYEKQNGNFVKSDESFNAKFPRLSHTPEESINGEIYHAIISCFNRFDTIQLKFYIVDRKLNKSNVEETIVIR